MTKKIAVIEDNKTNIKLIRYQLKAAGFDIKVEETGNAGLKMIKTLKPDMIILDIGLPDIGGHEILEALSQLDPYHYVIMFSGRRDKANLLKALRLGAQGFIGKPFSRDKLAAYIERSPFIIEKSKHIKDNEVAK